MVIHQTRYLLEKLVRANVRPRESGILGPEADVDVVTQTGDGVFTILFKDATTRTVTVT